MENVVTDNLKLVLSPQDISQRVTELAAEISRDLGGRDLVLVGILKGAFIFLSDLARRMSCPCCLDFVRVASYGPSTESSGHIELIKPPEMDLSGRAVVVVEDIVDTGLTVRWLKDYLGEQGCHQVRVCALIDKPERRKVHLDLDYVGFRVPKGFLVGYGLDYNEQYRYLPGVYEIIDQV